MALLSDGASVWGLPPKICKGDALLHLNLEEAGTATRLLPLLLLGAPNYALVRYRDQGEPAWISASQLIRQGGTSLEKPA